MYFSCDGVLFHKLNEDGDLEILYYPYDKADADYVLPSVIVNETEYENSGITHDVVTIPYRVFSNRKFSTVEISETVTYVSMSAFYSDKKLTSVVFAEGGSADLYIEDNAFRLCSALTDITLPSRYAEINVEAFSACTNLINVTVAEGVQNYSSENGLLLSSDGSTLIYYPAGRSTREVVTGDLTTGNIAEIGENAFAGNTNIMSVTISASVTEISRSAFENCTQLMTLTFADYVNVDLVIDEKAFYGCINLTEVTLPSNLVSLAENAFGGCSRLAKVYYDARPDTKIEDLDFAAGAFGSVSYVEELALGVNVPAIDFVAIFGGTNLAKVTIETTTDESTGETKANPNFVSDEYGVVYDSGLTSILYCPTAVAGAYVMPDTVQQISATTFVDHAGVTSITIGKGVNTIADGAFVGCTSLTELKVADGNSNYAAQDGVLYRLEGGRMTELIYCPVSNAVTELTIPSTVSKVDANAFRYNAKVTSVTFEAATLEMGTYAFAEAGELVTVVLPDGMTSIPSHAFDTCAKLASVNIPASVQTIESYAFYECAKIKGDLNDENDGLTLPYGLSVVKEYAFYNCKLLYATIPASVETIGDYAFYYCWGTSGTTKNIVFDAAPEGQYEAQSLSIGDHAFANTRYALGVNLPGRLSSMDGYAFYYLGYSTSAANFTTVTFGEGCSITSIPTYAFDYARYMSFIEIPETVTTIGACAFMNCTTLAEIEIPASVTSIAFKAFSGATKLEKLTFAEGSTLSSIGYDAFNGDKVLYGTETGSGKVLELPASLMTVDFGAFENCTALTYVDFLDDEDSGSSSLILSGRSFKGCTALTGLNLPGRLTVLSADFDNVASDYTGMFDGCTSLASVSIPSGVTEIGVQAFNGCTKLVSVIFETEDGGKCALSKIDDYAFKGCTALKEIEFPESTASSIALGKNLFEGSGVETVTLSSSVLDVGAALLESSLTEIKVADSHPVYSVGNYDGSEGGQILYSSTSIVYICAVLTEKEIEIPNTITSIGAYAFYDQTNIESVTIPSSVTSIGDHAFYGCTSLKNVVFEGNIYTIPDYCFTKCDLSETELPRTIQYIGAHAFESTKIATLALPSVLTVDEYAFADVTTLESVEFGNSFIQMGAHAFEGCTSLSEFNYPSSLTVLPAYAFSGCTALKEIVIPTTVASVGEYAFYNCTGVLSINLPGSLGTISDGMFDGCSALTYLELPDGIETIGSLAFAYCTSLEEVYLPDSLIELGGQSFRYDTSLVKCDLPQNLQTMGANIFRDGPTFTDIVIPDSVTSLGAGIYYDMTSLKTAVIGEGVKTIGDDEFRNCSGLESVTIGSNVTTINQRAFYQCTSLKEIIIPLSVTSFGSLVFSSCVITFYFEATSWSGNTTAADGSVSYFYSEEEPGFNETVDGYVDTMLWHYNDEGEAEVWTFNYVKYDFEGSEGYILVVTEDDEITDISYICLGGVLCVIVDWTLTADGEYLVTLVGNVSYSVVFSEGGVAVTNA